jgi:hypothetical protein
MYQGLETLNALTNRAATSGLTSTGTAQMQKRFAAGLAELGAYVGKADLDAVRMVQGTSRRPARRRPPCRATAPSRSPARSTKDSLDTPVAAFEGDTKFSITIKVPVGLSTSYDHRRARSIWREWGPSPGRWTTSCPTSTNSLRTGGFQTRIGRQQIKEEPKTVQVNGKPVTLPAGPDKWALAIRGTSTETVGFTADRDLRRRLCRPVRGQSGDDGPPRSTG